MNKKIIISLITISVVGIIAVGGTIAYFSDTEISSGNTFTAGSIDLKVDNECSYNGVKCICPQGAGRCCFDADGQGDCDSNEETCYCTWEEKDLEDEVFFNFADLKPGDWGEDTISLRVENNDAWACAYLVDWEDTENGCVDPEKEAGDDCETNTGNPYGELAENLEFAFWWDIDGDNVYEPDDGEWLFGDINTAEGLISEGVLTIVDRNPLYPRDPLEGGKKYYIGKVWCFGDLAWDDTDKKWTCDGSGVGNKAQTDKLTGTIKFYVVQARNNSDFVCPTTPPTP